MARPQEYNQKQAHYALYNQWQEIMNKTRTETYNDYNDNIGVCIDWYDFKEFYSWALQNGYQQGLVIDRKDKTQDYTPLNCVFVTKEQKGRVKRSHFVTYRGETKRVATWAREYRMHPSVLNARLRRGWTFAKAVKTKLRVHPNRKLNENNEWENDE